MELNFENAKQNLDDYKTASGADIPDNFGIYYEMYRDVFCDAIDVELLLGCEFSYPRLLTNASRAEYMFDLLELVEGLPNQMAHIAAFGLVLFDRMVRARYGSTDAGILFDMHETLFECFELVREVEHGSNYARTLANRRHEPGRRAKAFVCAEWIKHKDAYNGNKSEFSRAYVGRVRNEFVVDITEKQMREVWLKDNPVAADR